MGDQRELTWRLETDTGKAVSDIQEVDKQFDKVKESMEDVDKKSSIFDKIGGPMKSAGSAVSAFGGKVMNLGGGMMKTGAKLTAFTAPVSLALKEGVQGALELDTAIRQVTTLADEDVLPVSKIQDEVRKISDASGIAQAEISNSMYEALSSGVDSSDVVGFVDQAVKLTKAGFTDMPTVIDATTTAMNAYGLSGQEAVGHIQDVFVKTQDLGKITVDELGKSIGRVIPFASAAGVSIDQLGAGYSILTAKGQNAQIATTNLSSLISELSTSGTKADKALRENLGGSFKELMENGQSMGDVLQSLQGIAEDNGESLGDMFGNKMATSAANALMSDGAGAFNDTLNKMVNSGGAVDANYEKMIGPAEKLQRAQNKLKNSLIELGGALAPVIEKFSNGLSKITDKFNSLSDETKGKIAKIAGAVAVAGPIIAAVGAAFMVVGGVIKAVGIAIMLLASPIGLVAAGIAAVVAVGYLLYDNWELIKQKASEVWDGISTKISEVALSVATTIGEFVEGIKLKFDEFVMAVGEKFETAKAVIIEKFTAMKEWVGTIIDGIKLKIDTFAQGMATAISGAIETVKGMFEGLRSKAVGAIEGIKSAWNGLKNLLSKPINAVVNVVKSGVGKIKSLAGFATGLYRVPYDEFPAMLHKDEMVVNASGSEQLRAMGATEKGFSQTPTNTGMGDVSSGVINNTASTNNSSFSPHITVNYYGQGNAQSDGNVIADIVDERIMSLFNTANLQRG